MGLGVTTKTGAMLMGLGLATAAYHAHDIKAPNIDLTTIQTRINTGARIIQRGEQNLKKMQSPFQNGDIDDKRNTYFRSTE